MPDQTISTQLVSTMLRPRLGFRHWFVFDSCMSPATAAEIVPSPLFVTTVRIEGRRFIFKDDGQPALVPRRDFTVHGIVWEVCEVAIACLDLQLEVPHDYHRMAGLARDPAGKLVLIEFYTPRNPRPERPGQADPTLIGPIREAARQWGFPAEYLEQFGAWA